MEEALNEALKSGYRHIDTATAYNNEHVIGKVLNEWITSGKVTRDELFIVTKVLTRHVQTYLFVQGRPRKKDQKYIELTLLSALFPRLALYVDDPWC